MQNSITPTSLRRDLKASRRAELELQIASFDLKPSHRVLGSW